MMRLKVITQTFLAIYAVMVLATIAFPLAAAFISWNISWFDDKAIYLLSILLRLELVFAAFIAIAVGFHPEVIQAAYENKLAKDILEAKRKML
jgi:hypothetical protein